MTPSPPKWSRAGSEWTCGPYRILAVQRERRGFASVWAVERDGKLLPKLFERQRQARLYVERCLMEEAGGVAA